MYFFHFNFLDSFWNFIPESCIYIIVPSLLPPPVLPPLLALQTQDLMFLNYSLSPQAHARLLADISTGLGLVGS